jgi:hypothetical protein
MIKYQKDQDQGCGDGVGNVRKGLADVSQSCTRGQFSYSGRLNTCVRASLVWSFDLHRPLTPAELMSLHGWADYDFAHLKWSVGTSLVANGMTATQLSLVLLPALDLLGFLEPVPLDSQ